MTVSFLGARSIRPANKAGPSIEIYKRGDADLATTCHQAAQRQYVNPIAVALMWLKAAFQDPT